jgi:hypothetical protein
MIPDQLRLQPSQKALTPEQEAEAKWFAAERIQVQLATAPVDEPETEWFLSQAYQQAKQDPPRDIFWLSGPLQLVAVLTFADASYSRNLRDSLRTAFGASIEDSLWEHLCAAIREADYQDRSLAYWRDELGFRFRMSPINNLELAVEASFARFESSLQASLWASLQASLGASVEVSLRTVRASVEASLWDSIRAPLGMSFEAEIVEDQDRREFHRDTSSSLWTSVRASIGSYESGNAARFACARFLEGDLGSMGLHALVHVNERVSGSWLKRSSAILVRRPTVLARDTAGRLHSEQGKCLEYGDGWGFYAWHGVRVPERVILAPEQLTSADWSEAEDVEVQRVIQERMGERFVTALGGVVLDNSSRGTRLRGTLAGG